MSDAAKENDWPAPATRSAVPPPSPSRSSRTRPAAPAAAAAAPAAGPGPLPAPATGDDRPRACRDVVVVEARVMVVHPADQPHGDVVVAEQELVAALLGVVLDEVRPLLGARGEV